MRVHLIGQLTPDSSPATLQFCGPVSCGFPSPAADYQEPDLSLDKLVGIGPTSSIFLFRAFGDSMIGAGIHDGDLIAVDKSRQAQPGKVVLAVDHLASLLSEADATILELYDRIADLERQLPASNVLPLDPRGHKKL